MLSIPVAIQDLFRTDSVRKNFRVQFPDGERADLTNSDIVAESVKFTESICSQDTFRIGLAELAIIEFETVGISDMRGQRIFCFCEIDTSSLTPAQISAIQANPGDGELVLAAASDLGYGFYRVPYGEFVVASCPRNHEAMAHRQVTAYSPDPFRLPNPVESGRLLTPIWRTTLNYYRPDVALLAVSQLAYHDRELLLQLGFTESNYGGGTGGDFGAGAEITVRNTAGQTLKIQMTHCEVQLFRNYYTTQGNDVILGFELQKNPPYSFWHYKSQVLAFLRGLNVAYTTATITGGPTVQIESFDVFADLVTTGRPVVNGVRYGGRPFYALSPFVMFQDTEQRDQYTVSRPIEDTEFFAAYVGVPSPAIYYYIAVPCGGVITATNLTTGAVTKFDQNYSANYGPIKQIYTYTPPSLPLLGKRFNFVIDNPVLGQSNFYGSFDMGKLITDYLEVMGKFCRPSRMGGAKVFSLSDSTTFVINRPDYETVWWDEYAGETIGLVRFTIKLSDTENVTRDYRFGNGQGVYDMSDNTLFVDTGCTEQEAISTLQAFLVPALQGLALGTVELEGRGQPELESGDHVSIQTADTALTAYITRQTISGEQRLKNAIEQVGEQLETQEGFA